MDVSFIVPLSSQLSLAEESLASILKAATKSAFEILFVGDSSSSQIAREKTSLQSDRSQIIDAGYMPASSHLKNLGAAHAKGRILLFLSPGTCLEPDALHPLISTLNSSEKIGLVGSTDDSVNGFSLVPDSLLSIPQTNKKTPANNEAYQSYDLIHTPSVAIKKKLFYEIGGFDEAYITNRDLFDLCLRLHSDNKECGIANRSRVCVSKSKSDETDPVETARDERYLQRRWRQSIRKKAAANWPTHYLAGLLQRRQAFESRLALEALARWTRLISSPSPTGSQIADGKMCSNEIKWARMIEKKMPSEIRKEQCKQHGNWLKERISYTGLFLSLGNRHGVWLKEEAEISLPRGISTENLTLSGEIHPPDSNHTTGSIGIRITINDTEPQIYSPLKNGPFSIKIPNPAITPEKPSRIKLQLLGAERANTYAYLGRILEDISIVPKKWRQKLETYRPQQLNQRLCIHQITLDEEHLLDFKSNPSSPQCFEFVRNNSDLGINLVGWHTAELGVGESARVAAKALQASKIAHTLIPLKATCLANKADTSVSHLLQENNPYPINVFHIDAPQSKDIDPSHGKAFRNGKYNIGYWAWELPEFPDAWIENFKYFDEIWAPSNFVRDAIAAKSPIPVVTIPHCIDFQIPSGNYRTQLNLPGDKYLFCFAYDLNSYQPRKNPQAVIEAYRHAFLSSDRREDVGLVIKTQSRTRNPEAYAKLLTAIEGVTNCFLIDETLPRETVYGLMNACDSYVSLHRSEGFGLTVAETMFLGKPVLSTNWSATSEFLDPKNGCPVDYRLIELEETHGPYSKGQIWADPSPEDAAQYMLKLVNDSEYASVLGQNAAQSIRDRFSPQRVAKHYENRLKAMCAW